jgi:hypothetical protein
MTESDFCRLRATPTEHRAALLANPHGYLPTHLAESLVAHIYMAYWTDGPDGTRRWQLQPSEASALADERARLDQWWERRSFGTVQIAGVEGTSSSSCGQAGI